MACLIGFCKEVKVMLCQQFIERKEIVLQDGVKKCGYWLREKLMYTKFSMTYSNIQKFSSKYIYIFNSKNKLF